MYRRVIPLQVTDEYVRGAGVPVGAAGSHDDVALRLAFGPMWAGTARSIVWRDANGEHPTITALTTDMLAEGESEVYLVPIPAEPKRFAGQMVMTIKGATVSGGTETTATLTATARFTVMESEWSEDAETGGDITPTQAEQFQAEIDSIKTTIVNAGISERNAKASEEAAAYSEQAAQTSKEFAQAFAARADASKDEAQRQAAAAANYAAAAERSRAAITDMSVSAEALPTGLASVQKSQGQDGTYHLHFGLPKGDTGSVGLRGPAGPQGVEGPQGVPGPRGINGVAVAASGTYAFNVNEDGHLILNYTGDTAPDFSINEDGHLILNL